ncbi:DUF1850 domain-containing protein [Aquibium oceanicum]|uniref:DUF1850 domain-containing protein n=1 Tax=Aquibium oceanicum TaxID=1670800 RepID=A0A1L3SVU5_9HYPH|nr:DUF1850 domain-containing protein [Aquibium oceanicum]APH73553.1 hypothetical protein BSQ44_20880 [Aquibium oceanicum]
MPLCILAAGKTTVLAAAAFTLSWTHSVEKTRWEEDWRVTPAGLELAAARVEGTGAGMEIPDGAVLKDGMWTYHPALPPQEALRLASSGATVGGWMLCADGNCLTIGAEPAEPVEIRGCED